MGDESGVSSALASFLFCHFLSYKYFTAAYKNGVFVGLLENGEVFAANERNSLVDIRIPVGFVQNAFLRCSSRCMAKLWEPGRIQVFALADR